MENRKVLRSPVVKRRSRAVPVNQRVSLERVIGITASSNVALSCDPHTSTVAYPAGCVVVLCNPRRKQSHIYNFAKKTIQTLAFSPDGKHVVTGESGHQPAVRVWDVEEKTQVAEFHGHKFGISCVAFSPNNKHIVSIGTQHDMMVNVWNWKTGTKVASNKISSKVSAVAFSDDGSMFVTVGNRHVKFWYLESNKSRINETLPLQGRSGILGDQKNNHFCDVVCGRGHKSQSVFCITQSGLLCEFNTKRLLEKWVELRTTSANCISAGEKNIFIGCANGIVRVFSAKSLQYVTSLPHPHCLGVDVSSALNSSQMVPHSENAKFPDTIALVFDEHNEKVTCVYNDHSVYIWDVHDLKRVGKAWSYLHHSSCIWGLEIYPMLQDKSNSVLPPGSFVTCSLDDTIRIWNLDTHMKETESYKRNVYSNELLKIAYTDPSLMYIRDVDYNPAGGTDKTDTNYDGKNGIRSLKVSPDGQHLASGDRIGTVRIHDLQRMKILHCIEAHEGEVLCVEYSSGKTGPLLLATASRDRLVHVFDVEQKYGLIQTLDDHSSSISAVRFTEIDMQLKMLSCGADKSLLFRNAQSSPEFQFVLSQHLVGKTTLYDMVVDPTQKFVATACQDRNIRIYNIKTAKQKKHYKGSLGDDGTLIKVQLDPSGTYAATSCTDKNICIIDFCTGELVATMYGHSEIISGIKFSNDLKHLISVSGDSCIFVWRLPSEMTKQMRSRLADLGQLPMDLKSSKSNFNSTIDEMSEPLVIPKEVEFKTPSKILAELNSWEKESRDSREISPEKPNLDYRFSVGQLPKWAKSKMGNGEIKSPDEQQPQQPRGKWASRVDSSQDILSQLDGKKIESDPNSDRKKLAFAEDGNSLDQNDLRRETMVLPKPENTPRKIPVIHASDDEDDDDDDDFFPQFHKKDDQNPWDDLQNFKSRKSDQTDGSRLSWLKRQSFNRSNSTDDLEDLDFDSDNTSEVIYYPPSDTESVDTAASSYTVFANGSDTLKRMKNKSGKSNPDGDSESTDPVSLEDVEDDDDSLGVPSYPTTPCEDFKTPDREKFLKDTFENLSFTPVEKAKFLDQLENEANADNGGPSAQSNMFNSRLSISSRFLSRAQQANIRNIAVYNSIQRQDNWFDSLQRRKDEMARAVDETRKRLLAMGWNDKSPEGEIAGDTSPVKTENSSVQPLDDDIFEQITPTNKRQSSVDYVPQDAPQSPSVHKTLRRCWSTFDLPKQPIIEEKPPLRQSLSNPSTPRLKCNGKHLCAATCGNRLPQWRSRIPTPISCSMRHIPRTYPQRVSVWDTQSEESDEIYVNRTPTNRTSRPQSRPDSLTLKPDDQKSTPRSRSQSSLHRKQTESSKAKMMKANSSTNLFGKPEDKKDTTSKRLSSNLTKSASLQNLNNQSLSAPKPPKRKSKSTKLSSMYTSVPNLLSVEDATTSEDSSVEMSSNLQMCSNLSLSNPDLLDSDDGKMKKPDRKITGRVSVGSNLAAKKNVQTKTTEGRKNWRLSLPSGISSDVKSNNVPNVKNDRDLMPPPPTLGIIPKSKQDTFVKRAVQAKRRATSELTLDQAKDILLGKSGILSGGQNSADNSPTSPTTTFTVAGVTSKPRNVTTYSGSMTTQSANTEATTSTVYSARSPRTSTSVDNSRSPRTSTSVDNSRSPRTSTSVENARPPRTSTSVDRNTPRNLSFDNSSENVDNTYLSSRIQGVACEIDAVAAEIKRKAVVDTAFNRLSELDASPNDLPERDYTPPKSSTTKSTTHSQNYLSKDVKIVKPDPGGKKDIKRSNSRGKDIPKRPTVSPRVNTTRKKSGDSSNETASQVKGQVQTKTTIKLNKAPVNKDVKKSVELDKQERKSVDSDMEEELASSLSVKERIANLTAQASMNSPRSSSPRMTSSAQITLSSTSKPSVTPTKATTTSSSVVSLSPHSSSGVGSSLDSDTAAKMFASPGSSLSPQSYTDNITAFDADDIYSNKTSPEGLQQGFTSPRNSQGFSAVKGALNFSPSKDSLREILDLTSTHYSSPSLHPEEDLGNCNMSLADALAAVSSPQDSGTGKSQQFIPVTSVYDQSTSELPDHQTPTMDKPSSVQYESSHQSLTHTSTAYGTTTQAEWAPAHLDGPAGRSGSCSSSTSGSTMMSSPSSISSPRKDNLQLCMEVLKEFRQDFKKVTHLYEQVHQLNDEKSLETRKILEEALRENKNMLTEFLSRTNSDKNSDDQSETSKNSDRDNLRDQLDRSSFPRELLEPVLTKVTDALLQRVDEHVEPVLTKVTDSLLHRVDEHVEKLFLKKIAERVDQHVEKLFNAKFKGDFV